MKCFKVAGIIGARPQFIKAAAFTQAYLGSKFQKKMSFVWIHTGQHYHRLLSNVFFKELSLPTPKHNLGVGSMAQGAQTRLMIQKIEAVLIKEKPDGVLVFGDTNSTLAGALAAAKLGLPVFHVEAGLRSFNYEMPEEMNRVLTDKVSSLLFCPTQDSLLQLKREGITKGAFVVGDVMADILKFYRAKLGSPKEKSLYYLATIHRNTNTDDPLRLEKIFKALSQLDRRVLFPIHPRTSHKIKRNRAIQKIISASKTLRIVKPVSYLEMLNLEKHAMGIITDSGGVQKEAFLFRVPCVTLRDETEWQETVRYGLNRLCEPESGLIVRAFRQMAARKKPAHRPDGNGDASRKILRIILGYLSKEKKKGS